ncbi:LPXTG cell wall anchor domain-containing protein [Carnobacterium divergens]|uniref:LPXTG cell wall anchor domain-containing protein n=1 Tax=Carnobacterium divergens TaxID=2748 RepID=UPI00143202B9|nr:LPXTG cell wall anchor domain-containing protein [Carnobacterium divergens]
MTIRFQVKITDISSDTATILNIASLVSDDPAITENQELDSNEVQTIVTKPVVPPAAPQPNPLPLTNPTPPDNQKLPQTGDEGSQLIRQVGLLLLGLSTLYFTHKRRTRISR